MEDGRAAGLGAQFNRALQAISETMARPWTLIRPGALVTPLVSASEAASQATTRAGTPAPESRHGTRPASPEPEPAEPPRALSPIREEEDEPRTPAARQGERSRTDRKRKPRPSPERAAPKRRREEDGKPEAAPAGPAEALVNRVRRAQSRPRAGARLGSSDYQAVDARGRFGLVECGRAPGDARPRAAAGQTLVLAHTPRGQDPLALLDLRPGDRVRVLSPGGTGQPDELRIDFVTRSGYFAPGRPVTSVVLGVPSADWARAARG